MEKIPVSKPALIKRINRRLAKEGRLGYQLKKDRGYRWRSSLGEYYVLDINRNFIVRTHVNLEAYGNEIGALEPYEELVEE